MHSVAFTHQKYNESFQNKKNGRQKENHFNEKKKITKEIAVVTQKYEQFQKLCKTLNSEFVSAIKLAEEKNDMTLVVKGNALKRRSEEAFEDTKCKEILRDHRFAKRKTTKDAMILFLLYLLFGKKLEI